MKNIIYILFLFVFISCDTSNDKPYVQQYIDLSGSAFEMLFKVNQLRTNSGLNKLQGETKLMELAQDKADDMNHNHYIDHRGFYDRQVASGCAELGECLSYNYNSVESSFIAWESSKMHYLTLLKKHSTGFGYGENGKYRCILIANYVFGKKQSVYKEVTETTSQGTISVMVQQ